MRILITGAGGRLGSQLLHLLNDQQHTVMGVDLGTMDITNATSVKQTFKSFQPELVIHCAALTAVDYCAEHPDEALAINGFGTQTIAQVCQTHNAALLYVSTNEVFDGKTLDQYQEYDTPHPINPYGYSKWVGEQAVQTLVHKHYIVRTAWLFAHGGQNFVHTMLRYASEGRRLRVVTNEIANPTYNHDLAEAICRLISTESYGIYHLTNDGYTSRYGFAREILDLAGYPEMTIEPIALAEYPRASRPPEYSALRNFAAAQLGITLRPWQAALKAFLETEQLLKKLD